MTGWTKYDGIKLPGLDVLEQALTDPRDATITLLASLLDGVLADDPQAIRDAAAWLTTNRPEVEG